MDIHPAPEHKAIEYRLAVDWTPIGEVRRTEDFLAEVVGAETLMQRAVDSELFSPISNVSFQRLDYFESSGDWPAYLGRPRSAGFIGDESFLPEAMRRLDIGETCLRVASRYRVASYTRVP